MLAKMCRKPGLSSDCEPKYDCTRYYQFPADAHHKWSNALKPFSQSDGVAFSLLENHTCAVIIGNIGGQYPPTDAAAFEQRLAVAIGSYLPTLLQDAQPLDDPRGYRIPVCVRHHFGQMEEWPHGLLVMGDAFCNFDPIYGQGMSVAAIEAETLARCLHEQQSYPQPGFERHVLQRMAVMGSRHKNPHTHQLKKG